VRLLLDTHAMYWYIEDDPQLSGTARTLIQDASNEILISPASYWEIAIKISIRKWRLNRPYEEFINIGLNQYGFQILPILPTHTARLIGLPFPPGHKDPFDRLLVSQALVEQIPIVSADSALDTYGVTRLW
jgi:PIN domain nuclease of toxin-antitoxin system